MLSQYYAPLLISFFCLIDSSIAKRRAMTTTPTIATTTLITTTTTTALATVPCQPQYSLCGGPGYTGPTCCQEPYSCLLSLNLVPTPYYACGVPPPTSIPTPPPRVCASEYAQCGGYGFTGPNCCLPGLTCFVNNEYFHNCYSSDPGVATAVTCDPSVYYCDQ